jgi:hypothetical protein
MIAANLIEALQAVPPNAEVYLPGICCNKNCAAKCSGIELVDAATNSVYLDFESS